MNKIKGAHQIQVCSKNKNALLLSALGDALAALLQKSAAAKICTVSDHLAPCCWRNVHLLKKNPLTVWPGKSHSGSPLTDLAGTAVLQKCLSFLVLLLSGGTWHIWVNFCCTVPTDAKLKRSKLNVCTVYVYCVRCTLSLLWLKSMPGWPAISVST